MKQGKKKLSALILSFIMIVTSLPLTGIISFAQTSVELEYEVISETDKTCKITDYSGTDTEINIPSEIDGNKVIEIGGCAFFDCISLEKITIPDSVTSIGDSAFHNCSSITSIDIPDSVTYIGPEAFSNCTSLKSVTMPSGITEIAEYEFYNCTSLESIIIPEGVVRIGERAFEECRLIKSIDIPNSVKYIGAYAFLSCAATSVTIPDSVVDIGGGAFGYTNNVELNSYDKIENFTITGYKASEAENYANINEFAFISLGHVTRLTYKVLSEADKTCTITGYTGSASELVIPWNIDGYIIRDISDWAFFNCDTLTSVAFLDDLVSIGEFAFEDCNSLKDVYIPKSVDLIGYKAFGYCNNGTEKIEGFTIHGYTGSAAEKYAKANGFNFVSLGNIRFGDVNGNYDITIADARLVLQSVANIKTLSEGQKLRADLNGDDKVTIVDARWILQIVAGLRDEETLKLK